MKGLSLPFSLLFLAVFVFSNEKIYKDEIAIKLADGISPQEFAKDHDLHYLYSNKHLPNYHLFKMISSHDSSDPQSLSILKKSDGFESFSFLDDDRVEWFEQQHYLFRESRSLLSEPSDPGYPGLLSEPTDLGYPGLLSEPTDPGYPKQWFYHDSSLVNINITHAWEKGYTGKGIRLSVIDDGVQWKHPDIVDNYNPLFSWDFCDGDTDPRPHFKVCF